MIQIGDKIVSLDLREAHFICDLHACKGACCVEGDAGAPLTEDEALKLEEIFPIVAPYLPPQAIAAIEAQGFWVENDEFLETPLVNGKECAYVTFDDGMALCGIEKAYRDGKIDFQKPISCHLYPIRIHQLKFMGLAALNYDKWHICKPACALGEKMQVPVYKFLREPLTRRFGAAFYEEMCEVFAALDQAEPEA
jgi:Protein of unknown function (DUF3109)